MEACCLLPLLQLHVGQRLWISEFVDASLMERRDRSNRLAATHMENLIGSNLTDPGLKAGLFAELPKIVKGLQNGLLNGIFRFNIVAEPHAGEPGQR
jgi:hypothetical protein